MSWCVRAHLDDSCAARSPRARSDGPAMTGPAVSVTGCGTNHPDAARGAGEIGLHATELPAFPRNRRCGDGSGGCGSAGGMQPLLLGILRQILWKFDRAALDQFPRCGARALLDPVHFLVGAGEEFRPGFGTIPRTVPSAASTSTLMRLIIDRTVFCIRREPNGERDQRAQFPPWRDPPRYRRIRRHPSAPRYPRPGIAP